MAEGKGPSKRALEKAAKKAAAKASKEAYKANAAVATNSPAVDVAVDPFRHGWLRGVYNEKPVKEVHTRFPPEPNGYLHIGHAKAITVNFGFARSYHGVCNLRFDDTNPVKEEARYFDSIEEMVRWLGFTPYKITYSSDEFDKLYEFAEDLINRGKAYVCHCSADEMKKGRGILSDGGYGPRSACVHRDRPVEENLAEFRGMRDGKYAAGEATLRLKQYLVITEEEAADPTVKKLADNPIMWDIPCYRVTKNNYHHRTGNEWRIYPMYDFAHPLCDALEGISHSLCTTEFEASRAVYNWVLEQLDMKIPGSDETGPMQREYGRLNVEGTILSKRKIMALVNGFGEEDDTEEVSGWDDPRLFTLVALRRRGVPPGALKKFVLDLGVTKSNANTMTHNLDSCIRNFLERTVPRLMLVLDPIPVVLTNLEDNHHESCTAPFDPKDPSKGTHAIPFTKKIFIDRDDFRTEASASFFRLAPGASVGLLNAEHPIRCTSYQMDPISGKVTSIEAEFGSHVPAGKTRIHWVSAQGPVRAEARIYNSLFHSSRPGDELDWKNGGYYKDVREDSLVTFPNALIETGFTHVRDHAPWPKEEGGKADEGPAGIRFQGMRTGFFAVDQETKEGKVVLNRIVSLREDSGKTV
ncbi:glutaminyl-tRNA synthetase [Piedraia hortae CBS 480.64]|uniref:glutamine--tRNA ligase n=1 Tax=Piedraia hortae CBS 480.64 TaxID=1314780 RepID=A0A6A7BXU1_9PEZI|nr:glutaminyl-tRNA synthetase [Piedraia hortae CBS 480.64]